MRRLRSIPMSTLAIAIAVSAAWQAGCYRHVVEVRGGPSNVPVHEPNIGPQESVWSNPRPEPRPVAEGTSSVGFPGRTP